MKGFPALGRIINCGTVVFICVGLMAGYALASSPNQVMPRTITAVAGSASSCTLTGSTSSCPTGYTGDGGQATAATLATPRGIAVDAYGNVFIADSNNNVIRRVDAVTGIITTYAGQHYTGSAFPAVCTGGDSKGNGCQATQAIMSSPRGLGFDNQGNLLVSDYSFNEVRKVDRWTKIITLVAGTGTAGYSGDGGPATKAQVNNPRDIAVDANNNIYIVDATNNIIRMVSSATGNISTVAGNPKTAGYGGDGGPATSAYLNNPQGVSVDAQGNLYIADSNNLIIREVNASTGVITTIAGRPPTGCPATGGTSGCTPHPGSSTTPVPASTAQFKNPINVFVGPNGDILISDSTNNIAYRIDPHTHYMDTLVGSTASGCTTATDAVNDGCLGPQAHLFGVFGARMDPWGNLYVIDASDNLIRKVSTNVVFSGAAIGSPATQTIDVHSSPAASQPAPPAFAIASAFADFSIQGTPQCISNPDASSDCTLNIQFNPTAPGQRYAAIAATNGDGSQQGLAVSGMGQGALLTLDPALAQSVSGLSEPGFMARDSSGAVYVADTANNLVRKYAAGSTSATIVAGTGAAGYTGDGGLATTATLNAPQGVALDAAGNLYIADTKNNVVRKVTPAGGVIATVAGGASTNCSFATDTYGDACPATEAQLSGPQGVGLDAAGNLFIADSGNNVVREVGVSGTIFLFAGGTSSVCSGSTDTAGDGCLATQATLNSPTGIAVDPSFNIYIADTANNLVRSVNEVTGAIVAVAGNLSAGYSGDGGPAVHASLTAPTGLALDDGLDLAIVDSGNNVVRLVDAGTGNIATIAGNGLKGTGSSGVASSALSLNSPSGVAFDDSGNLYLTDTGNNALEIIARTSGSLQFGVVSTHGTSPSQTLTLSNGGNTALTLTDPVFTVSGADASDFSVAPTGTTGCIAGSLAAATSCTFTASFMPSALGVRTAGATFGSNALNTVSAQLSGTGATLTATTATITLISPTNSPAPYGTNITVMLQVQPQSGTGTPTGDVTFTVNGQAQPLTALSAGTATLTLAKPTPGAYVITASYAGDEATFAPSTSTAAANTTIAASATTTVLTISSASINAGAAATLTATVTSAFGITPSGTVIFTSGSTTLGTATLNASGVGTTSSIALAAGTYSVTATFQANTFFLSSASTAVSVAADPPGFTLSANPSSVTVSGSAPATAQITVTPVGGLNGTITLLCINVPANVSCQFSPALLTANGSNAPVTTKLTVSEGPPLGLARNAAGRTAGRTVLAFAVPGALCLLTLFGSVRRRHWKGIVLAALLSVALVAGSGCGSGTQDNFTGATSFLVYGSAAVASSTNVNQSLTMQITVQ